MSENSTEVILCNSNVNSVVRSLKIIHQTIENIAPKNVMPNLVKKIAQNVPFAENLCDLCATRIALALVAIKTSAFSNEELQAILDSIGNYKRCILIQNLVSFAELWENIDTIPTTENLSILCGSVLRAIENYTRPERKVRAEDANGLEKITRFKYIPKASKRERGEGNNHPTVKPLSLLKYLCRLTKTPTGGVVLDPFMGSGTTLLAARAEGRQAIGIELNEEYCRIAVERLKTGITVSVPKSKNGKRAEQLTLEIGQ